MGQGLCEKQDLPLAFYVLRLEKDRSSPLRKLSVIITRRYPGNLTENCYWQDHGQVDVKVLEYR